MDKKYICLICNKSFDTPKYMYSFDGVIQRVQSVCPYCGLSDIIKTTKAVNEKYINMYDWMKENGLL